jgi:uncharacterized membrane protein
MESDTTRVEFFSDAVFAIAITLLILDIKVPPREQHLAAALLHQWPSYLAFFVSFASIGTMWINHHRIFTYIKRCNDVLLLLNLLLLLGVSIVPFPTATLAEHLRGPDERIAALLYNGTFVYIATAFNVLWRYAVAHRLHREDEKLPVFHSVLNRRAVPPTLSLICFIIAWFDARASLIANAVLVVLSAVVPSLLEKRASFVHPELNRGESVTPPPPPLQ